MHGECRVLHDNPNRVTAFADNKSVFTSLHKPLGSCPTDGNANAKAPSSLAVKTRRSVAVVWVWGVRAMRSRLESAVRSPRLRRGSLEGLSSSRLLAEIDKCSGGGAASQRKSPIKSVTDWIGQGGLCTLQSLIQRLLIPFVQPQSSQPAPEAGE